MNLIPIPVSPSCIKPRLGKKGRKLGKKSDISSRRAALLRHRDWVSSAVIGPRSITTSMQTPSPADANIAVFGGAGCHVTGRASCMPESTAIAQRYR